MGRDHSHIARRCERAVVTAYRELRDTGAEDFAAFQACTTLYRVHHPEASLSEARRLVDGLRQSRKKFKDVQDALEAIYRQTHPPR
jgi:hypothetical protein